MPTKPESFGERFRKITLLQWGAICLAAAPFAALAGVLQPDGGGRAEAAAAAAGRAAAGVLIALTGIVLIVLHFVRRRRRRGGSEARSLDGRGRPLGRERPDRPPVPRSIQS